MVPKKGLEPPHPCGYMDLNHARLPIPPLRQVNALRDGQGRLDGRDYPIYFTEAARCVKPLPIAGAGSIQNSDRSQTCSRSRALSPAGRGISRGAWMRRARSHSTPSLRSVAQGRLFAPPEQRLHSGGRLEIESKPVREYNLCHPPLASRRKLGRASKRSSQFRTTRASCRCERSRMI